MKFLFLLPFIAVPSFAKTTSKPNEDLAATIGAISKVIGEKTQVAGKNEIPAKLTPPAEAVYKEINNDLENCQTSESHEPQAVTIQKDGVTADFKTFDFKIYGENCPFEISAQIKSTEQAEDKLHAIFVMKVVFKKQNYIEKYRLKFAEISGNIDAQAQKEADTIKIPVYFKMAGQGENLDLGPFSQSAEFKILIEANLSQFNFNILSEQTALLKYQDVSKKGYSRMKGSIFGQPEQLFTIDDQQVSESEFQKFMENFIIPGMISEEDPNSPDQKAKAQCSYVAYDKESITQAALKEQMVSSQLQTAGKLTQGKSCMSNVSAPFTHGAQSYTADLIFDKEWISFNGVSKTNPKLSGSVFVLYGDAAPQTTETDELILGLQCSPTPVCQ